LPTFVETLPASTTEFFKALEKLPFLNQGSGDLGNAWLCAEASALTYKGEAFIRELGKEMEAKGWG
jgi:hypothetical protein